MDENEKHLLTIRDEMENVRELYIKGYIDVKLINQKQENYLNWQLNMVHDKRNIEQIKNQLENLMIILKKKRNLWQTQLRCFGLMLAFKRRNQM